LDHITSIIYITNLEIIYTNNIPFSLGVYTINLLEQTLITLIIHTINVKKIYYIIQLQYHISISRID